MDSARTRTFPLVLAGLGILLLGFGAGFLTTGFLLTKKIKSSDLPFSSGRIMSRRLSAIKEAMKEGKSEYEFEVSGFHPILR